MKTYVNGRTVHLTEHAQARYIERVKQIYKPTPFEEARFARELATLIQEHGSVVHDAPNWMGVPPEDVVHRADLYVLIGSDVCLPVEHNVALTLLTRGSFSSERRADRNRRRQEQRARRQARRLNESWRGERAPRWR